MAALILRSRRDLGSYTAAVLPVNSVEARDPKA
jgi:hypothetical protein